MNKTKIQIIEETVEYYGADPVARRATYHGTCFYYKEGDTRLCAFSRCMIDPKRGKDFKGTCLGLVDHLGEICISRDNVIPRGILKPEYDGHSFKFWEDLQYFHDSDASWSITGLSHIGESYCTSLKEKYKD